MANYMIFDEKTIKNNFKFQIGKRYKINDYLCKGYDFLRILKKLNLKLLYIKEQKYTK